MRIIVYWDYEESKEMMRVPARDYLGDVLKNHPTPTT